MDRLEAIFLLIHPCGIFADIGCDHGLISEYALGYAKKIIAADISEKCLSKARQLLSPQKNIEFVVSDGFKNIKDSVDLAVIAGMGGHTIVEILTHYVSGLSSTNKAGSSDLLSPRGESGIKTGCFGGNNFVKTQFILQPQSETPLVRQFLTENGYAITNDLIACEGRRFYEVIKTQSGPDKLDDLQLEYGKFYTQKNGLLKQKLEQRLSSLKSFKQTPENQRVINEITEVLKWQR